MNSPQPAERASVLLAFRAENVRSFREQFEISLLATAMADEIAVRSVRWREGGHPIRVLPAACIFGSNGSGKSNVLRAMDDMRRLVLSSFRSGDPSGGIQRRPFLLDSTSSVAPSRFEIDLILDGVRHDYGFVLDSQQVIEEWAYWYPRGKAAMLFHRRYESVEMGSADRSKGRAVSELLRRNALFLSTAAAANHPKLLPLYEWFARNLRLAEAGSRAHRWAQTTEFLQDPEKRERVLALLRVADLGITDAKILTLDPQMLERFKRALRILNGKEDEPDSSEPDTNFVELGVALTHSGFDGDVEFNMADESLGTLVWLGLIGPVVDVLSRGSVMLADEIESSLHPTLVSHLTRLFQDPVTNPRRAQLIFNSHAATLLGDTVNERAIGRDQIWFTEKVNDGSTRLYPLTDLDPRKEEAIGRRYLAGRYGATPIVSKEEFTAAAELISSIPLG